MKILVEIPGDQFDRMLAGCAEDDREYAILRNGLVTPFGEGGNGSARTAVVLCDVEEAKLVMALAGSLGIDVARSIRQYPARD